jgi:hypothetical protein
VGSRGRRGQQRQGRGCRCSHSVLVDEAGEREGEVVREAVSRVATWVGDREGHLEHAPRVVRVATVQAVCACEDELSRGGGGGRVYD